jgi:hypothetical protein
MKEEIFKRDEMNELAATRRQAELRVAQLEDELVKARRDAAVAEKRYERQRLWNLAESLRERLARVEKQAADIRL